MPPSVDLDSGFNSDLDEAVDFQLGVSLDRAERFAHDFEEAIGNIRMYPELGAPYEAGTRRWVMARWGYSVIYLVTDDRSHIRFIAFPHASSPPGYWRERL